MRQHVVTTTLFSLSIVIIIGLISGCFGYVYVTQSRAHNSDITTVPHVYYSVKTITALDAQGNSTGNTSIFRVDGMEGQPVKIADLPTGVTGATWAPSTIQYDVWSKPDVGQEKFHVTVDNTGHEVWDGKDFKSTWGNFKDQVLTRLQWIHPDGTYATVSEIFCTNTPPEGPCDVSYRLKVLDLATNKNTIYTAKNFAGLDGQWVVKPLARLSETTVLVSLDAMQEPITGFVGSINFATGDVKQLYAMKPDYSGQTHGYFFLRLSDDNNAVLFTEWAFDNPSGHAIVSMSLADGSTTFIAKNIPGSAINWPKGSSGFYYEHNDGTKVIRRDVSTNTETLVARSTLEQYLHPTRFSAKTTLSSTGVYDGKLVVSDTLTGKLRIIYDQARNENAYGGNGNINGSTASLDAKVGDRVYAFLGIEQ